MKTILLADDNDGIVASLTMVLQFGGYAVLPISNGHDVRNIAAPLPDLVLLDIWMVGVNGLDLCKYLKAREDTKDIPVIMISAYPDSREMAFEAGANDFVEKPYSMDALLAAVARLLSSRTAALETVAK